MPSEVPPSANLEPSNGLPPVTPPTGKMMAQLFLVPLLIICGILLVAGGWLWLFGGRPTPAQFLQKLDDPNPEVRWRGAEDLAKELATNEPLACNAAFGLDVAERLQHALETNASSEENATGKPSGAERAADATTLEEERDFIAFLTGCLGDFMAPVGEPLLARLASPKEGADNRSSALRRRQALWALANLGHNLERLTELPPKRQNLVVSGLEKESASAGERGEWARKALQYVKAGLAHHPEALGIDTVLDQCANDRYPFSAKNAALALTYWEGNPEENARMEKTLARLLQDDGHGADDERKVLKDENYKVPDEADQSSPALEIHYQAAVALAWRGSARTPLKTLADMLDEPALKQCFQVKQKDGKVVSNDELVYGTMINTLKAIAVLHRKNPGLDLAELYPAVKQLANDRNGAIWKEAKKTSIALGMN